MTRYELKQDYQNPTNLGEYLKGYQFEGELSKYGYVTRIVKTKRYSCDNKTMEDYIENFDPSVLKEVD